MDDEDEEFEESLIATYAPTEYGKKEGEDDEQE